MWTYLPYGPFDSVTSYRAWLEGVAGREDPMFFAIIDVHVRVMLGAKTFAVFHIDVVVGTATSGEPDVVALLTPPYVDGLVQPSSRAFPLPDHVADKFAVILGTHVRGETGTCSSRIKDLVDITPSPPLNRSRVPRFGPSYWLALLTEAFPSQMCLRFPTRPCGGAATHSRRPISPGRRQHSMRPTPWPAHS